MQDVSSPAAASERSAEALSHNSPTSNTCRPVRQTKAALTAPRLLQSVSYFSFFNATKYSALVLTSKNPVLSLPLKMGQDFFFNKPNDVGGQPSKTGVMKWMCRGFSRCLTENSVLSDPTFCPFPTWSCEPEPGSGQNPPDTT